MSSATRLRVALVGCGRIAQTHCGYLRQVPEVELVGACDVDPAGREAFTNRWQLPSYASIDELLDAGRPDAAHIVTPPSTHAPLAVQLLEAGVHVLVEKPMAVTVDEADAMIAAAQRSGRQLTANHNRWFDPVMQRARSLVDSGRLGSLVGVEVFQGAAAGEADAPPGAESHWSARLPGGVLYNLAPHPTYLLRGFTGDVRDLQVVARTDEHGRLRELRAAVDGERCLGALTISLQTQPFTNRVVLYGSARSLEVNLNNMTLVLRQTRKLPRLLGKVAGKVLPNLEEAWQLVSATVVNGVEFLRGRQRYYPGMGLHFRALYRALAAGQEPPVTAEEARAGVDLLQRIWERAGVPMSGEIRRVANP